MFANVREKFGCIDCGYFTDVNCNIKRHMLSKQHIEKLKPIEIDPLCKHQCEICNKKYKNQSGLWSHNQKCKAREVVESVAQTIPELSSKIDKLESIISELVNNQQPSIINITNNDTFNINVFLNEKCNNACNLLEFLEKIQFKEEHFERILSDYIMQSIIIMMI
jgi:hypothetical protein